ncbi:hypothetical protein [Streptomyces sp. IMTB 1903]|uniref:hypothetical protein n=1 Tax=Streptomyces sp. IMTB 1903 TaxID=1776680 RepID=UPI000754BF42|nr:hypothetical protein [Streptomyces sp. IMTB 1903]
MAPKREIDEDTAGGRLALFLVDLTKNTSVRDLATKFGSSRSSWGNYLNGSQLIPKRLVGPLVQSFTVPGPRRETTAVQALALWNAAEAERHANRFSSVGGVLVRQHQRRDNALQQVIKYQVLAANAEKHLAELRPMLAYTKSQLDNVQLKLGDERERARVERQLGQARERLGRVRVQQERARGRRMTAEEQQEFWMAEVLAAEQEINRLEREVQDLASLPPQPLPPVASAARPDVDDTDFDARLEHITAEGLEDEALIEEDLQPTVSTERNEAGELHGVQAVQEGVQSLSNPGLDKPATSASAPYTGGSAATWTGPLLISWVEVMLIHPIRFLKGVERAALWLMHDSVPTERELIFFRKGLSLPLAASFCLIYAMAQSMSTVEDPGGSEEGLFIGQIIFATALGLPPLYLALRALTVPKPPARLASLLLHVTWVVLLNLDLLPWTVPMDLSK